MQVNDQVIKQCEIAIRHLARDIRKGDADSNKVTAISKLLDQYANLIRLSREDNEGSSFYDEMEASAMRDAGL